MPPQSIRSQSNWRESLWQIVWITLMSALDYKAWLAGVRHAYRKRRTNEAAVAFIAMSDKEDCLYKIVWYTQCQSLASRWN